MLAFWSWNSAVCSAPEGPGRTKMYNDTLQQNRTESKNRTTTNEDENKSVCISCGEQRHNARTEVDQ